MKIFNKRIYCCWLLLLTVIIANGKDIPRIFRVLDELRNNDTMNFRLLPDMHYPESQYPSRVVHGGPHGYGV